MVSGSRLLAASISGSKALSSGWFSAVEWKYGVSPSPFVAEHECISSTESAASGDRASELDFDLQVSPGKADGEVDFKKDTMWFSSLVELFFKSFAGLAGV
jgi:hypothetical protein